jgi:hypothetical protein
VSPGTILARIFLGTGVRSREPVDMKTAHQLNNKRAAELESEQKLKRPKNASVPQLFLNRTIPEGS